MVATTLCVGVVGMQHSGIGGGGFMLVRDADGEYESIGTLAFTMIALMSPSCSITTYIVVKRKEEMSTDVLDQIDFRETAPAASHENMFVNDPILSIRSGLASGVPGDVKGLEYLHQKYGVCILLPSHFPTPPPSPSMLVMN